VNDGLLDSAPDTVRISTTNTAPVANAGSNRNATVGTVVQLDGTASSDPDGNPLTFAWSIFSRPTGSTATIANATASRATITPDRAGVFAVRLVVSDGSLSSPQVTVNITATEPDEEGEGEGQEVCTAPAAPASISASDGTFADRVEVQWPTVTGATEYRVWRATTNAVSAATPLTGWVNFTTFNDTTATAAVVPEASGCQGAGDPTITVFFYWVQARSGEETECESALTGPNAGNRGVPATKSLGGYADVRVGALPLETARYCSIRRYRFLLGHGVGRWLRVHRGDVAGGARRDERWLGGIHPDRALGRWHAAQLHGRRRYDRWRTHWAGVDGSAGGCCLAAG
jgi:hypothetical protein